MQLTTNFNLSEFNKHGFALSETVLRNIQALANNLQVLRDEVINQLRSQVVTDHQSTMQKLVELSHHVTSQVRQLTLRSLA
jgi:hypothetical protein